MPIYEYKCSKCSQVFEILQKITDRPISVCSACGGELKKLITSTSFVLKGSGWYASDYPSADRKKAMEAEKPAGTSKETGATPAGEKKGESKQEAVNA